MKKVIEFFRVLTQLKYLIPLMRYKWPDPESNASLAHMFEEAVDQYSSRPFMYFDDEKEKLIEVLLLNIMIYILIKNMIVIHLFHLK